MSDIDENNQTASPKVIEDNVAPISKNEKEQDRAARDLGEQKKDSQLTMEVKVFSPFNVYFEGPAFSVTGENTTGVFDILPKHHNFICLLKKCTLIVRTAIGEERKIDISGGLMHVKADKLIVFLDI